MDRSRLYRFIWGVVVCFIVSGCSTPGPTPYPTATIAIRIITPAPTASSSAVPTASRTQVPAATRTSLPTSTPFVTPPPAGQPVAIPILMYHHLKYREPNASAALKTWSVAPDQFAAQLDFFQAQGFHTITFKQLIEFFAEGTPLPVKPIILTFDDGWIDDYSVAFPELVKRGMVGSFFPPVRYVNAGGELLINWDQVLEMDRAGMEFGGHTINHEDLTKVSPEVMRRELGESKQIMEERLGHPIYALSYPFGAFNPKVMAETRGAGYGAAVILCCGYKQASDILFALPRIRVSYDETLGDLAKKLP